MIHVSSEFREQMEMRTDFKEQAEVTFLDGTKLSLTENDFTVSNNSITDGAGSNGLPLGAAIQRQIQIELMNDDDHLEKYDFVGAQIRLYMTFWLPKTKELKERIEKIECGYFTVTKPETYGQTVIVAAVDDMYRADKAFYTTRIEQSSSNVISMYGKRQGDGDTPQSCTLNVAVVNTASDARLKDKVQYLDEETSLAFINKLRPAAYRYSADQDEMYHYGLIYQDVEPIIKSKNCALLGKFLRWEKQPDGKSKQIEYGALGYIELISDLIGAVKALTARVEKLERNNHD